MEKQNLPNSMLILVLGILSIVTCCCYGVPGLIIGVIAFILARNADKMYREDPDLYEGYNNVKTGKVLAIIGVILSLLFIIVIIITFSVYGGAEGVQEALEQYQQEMMREHQG